eukprot:Sdes_comp19821_c0_seq1m11978
MPPCQNSFLYTVKCILVLDNDGNRLLAKYYDSTFPTLKEQKIFEKNIFAKTHRANAEIALLEGFTVVYRSNVDLFFYVVGNHEENELMLVSVLNSFYDAVGILLRNQVEKRILLENLDCIFLALDEICDCGVILESDPTLIAQRSSMRSNHETEIPLSEQTISQAFASARDQLTRSLLK